MNEPKIPRTIEDLRKEIIMLEDHLKRVNVGLLWLREHPPENVDQFDKLWKKEEPADRPPAEERD